MKNKFIILLFLCPFFVFSQEEISEKKDLKVGLVLSGGGAKGFAHVAVIKVLEEAGVRVDYVGGTSIGAIIGSLYASGYNAKEIDSLIKKIDFEKIMLDEIPRKSKPFYEKEKGENHALVFPINNKKIGLPVALSKGQNVLNLITELLQHVDTISDFNNLSIPFLCIATDIETGNEVVLNKGFLPRAVQASGAFPTLLEPVEIDGILLVDGGVVNNFPVDQVIKMGADVIIGVDLGTSFDKREDLNSAFKIVNQIMSFQIYANYDEQIANTDVHIHPDLDGYGVASFESYDSIYKLGEKSARLQFDKLVEIANQQIFKRVHKPIVHQSKEITIKRIEIEGNQDYTKRYIKSKMEIEEGETISRDEFLEGVNNLTATGNFSNIQYQIIEEEDGSVIKLKLKQDENFGYLKLAAHYDDLYKTAVLANFTVKHFIAKNDIASLDLILGDNIRYNLDYFIDNGSNWSFGLYSRYNSFNTDVDFDWVNSSLNKVDLKYRDFTNKLYLQTVLNRKFALGVGAEHKNIRAYTETFITSVSTVPDDRNYFDKSNYYNFISYLKFDTYDKKHYQKSGVNLDVDFRWYLFSSDFNDNFNSFSQLKGEFGFAYTFFDKLTFHIITAAGITIGSNNNKILDYHLGGVGENYINNFIPFYGYNFANLTGDGFLLSTLKIRYELFKNNYLLTAVNVARVNDDIFNDGIIFENTLVGFDLGYGIDSFAGPIELNLTYSPDTKDNNWYFSLGYWF